MSHWWCCCDSCPICTVRTRPPICCPCVPLSICVTHTPTAWDAYEAENRPACESDDQECRPTSVELDWDEYEQAYIGSLLGHDLYYSFYRNEYDGKCYFYLESESLGRHEWEIKETADQCYGREEECITCLELDTAVGVEADPYNECAEGTITTTPVVWITPTSCSTCLCLCECLCVFVTLDGISYSGKACWDDYEQAYVGDVSGEDSYGVCHTRSVRVPIDRWGDVCDPNVDESDPTACEPVQVIDDSDYEPQCVITGTWTLDDRHGYRGEIRWAAAGSGDNTIEWRFTDLLPGRWKVSATWVPGDGRASDAPYTILAGTRILETVPVNQANLPDDFSYDGSDWERLGTYRITGGELTVRLTDDADGDVIADAIHLEYIDDRCGIGFEISAEEGESGEVDGWIHADWQLMTEPCELRSVSYSWLIERDPYDDEDDIEVSVRCATCNEECEPYVEMPCCDNMWPKNLTLSFTSNWPGDTACLCEYPQSFPVNWTDDEGWSLVGLWNCPTSPYSAVECLPHGVYFAISPDSCDINVMWLYGIDGDDPGNIGTWGQLADSLSVSLGNLSVITDDTPLAEAMAALEASMIAAGRKFETYGVLVCDPPMIWIRRREQDVEEWVGVDIIVTA